MPLSRIALVGILSAAVSGCMADGQMASVPVQVAAVQAQALPSPAPAKRAGPRARLAMARAAAVRKPGVTAAAVPVPVAPAPAPVASGPHEGPAPTIGAMVVRHAHDLGIPPGLAMAVVGIESRGNPRATNHGAMGLMQIKVQTARNQGFMGDASGLLSPDTNLTYGMKVLAAAYRTEGGDVCRTLAAYQSGHRVARFSAAQRHYCARARLMMAHL